MSKTKIAIAGGSGKMGNSFLILLKIKMNLKYLESMIPIIQIMNINILKHMMKLKEITFFVFVSSNNINDFINEIYNHSKKFKGIVIGSSGLSDKSIKDIGKMNL